MKTCALPGWAMPVERSNQSYCCPAHKQLGYRQRNKTAKTVTNAGAARRAGSMRISTGCAPPGSVSTRTVCTAA